MSALDKIMMYLKNDETNAFLTTNTEVGDILYDRINKRFAVAVPRNKSIVNDYLNLVNVDYVRANGNEYIHTKSKTFKQFEVALPNK